MKQTRQPSLHHLPLESLLQILAFAILPDDDIKSHVSTCTALRCDVVEQTIAITRKIRLISRQLSRILDASPLGCLCIRTSNTFNPLSSSMPPSPANLFNTISVDIDVNNITAAVISNLTDIIYDTSNLIRISISGKQMTPQAPMFRTIADPIQRLLANKKKMQQLRAILIDVPFDSYNLLLAYDAHDFLSAIHLTNQFPTYTLSNSTVTWNHLRSLSIFSESFLSSTPNAFLLFPIRSIPNVTKVVLYGDNKSTLNHLPVIFDSIHGSVTNLTVSFAGLDLNLPTFPSSDILQHFECNYDHASSLLTGLYINLKAIRLHGFTYNITTVKKITPLPSLGPTVSRKLDLCLSEIAKVEHTPNLKTVKLEYPFVHMLRTRSADISKSVRYAYLGAKLSKRGVDFLDANNELIMPNTYHPSPPL